MTLLGLDDRLTFALYRFGSSNWFWQHFWLIIAAWFVYLLPLTLLYLFFFGKSFSDKVAATKIFFSSIVTWQIFSKLIGNFFYSHYNFRDRPFAANGIKELFFERPTKAFPSDHSAVLVVAALLLIYYRYPKVGRFLLIGGLISGIARILVGFHFAGDILGGWALGAIAFLIFYYLDQPFTKLVEQGLTLVGLKPKQ